MRLRNKVALITGGSRGIGRAVALEFAREGARVAIVGVRDRQALTTVAREIEALGAGALTFTADVARRADIGRVVEDVRSRWDRIDVLVNNAGIVRPSRLEEISEEQWDTTLAVHLSGTFHGTQAVIPLMKAQGGGKIINIAAPAALRGSFGVADYAAAKGGIIAFTRNAASELKEHNIQVNCISPIADTRMTDAVFTFRHEQLSEPASRVRGATLPDPEVVAPAFVFFACSDSDYITGQVLAVDGGVTA